MLRDSLLARLDRLAPIREIAQIGACIGREFSYELLARISTLSNEQLEGAGNRLVDAGLLAARLPGPLASALRVLSAEFRHARMMRAEEKAARSRAIQPCSRLGMAWGVPVHHRPRMAKRSKFMLMSR